MGGATILILIVGLGLAYAGFGPLSLKKHPGQGNGLAVVGFLCRLAAIPLLAAAVAILAIGPGSILLILAVGIGLAYAGYGPLSSRKHPQAGPGAAVAGFVCRLSALVLLALMVLAVVAALGWHVTPRP
jgi:multisubunit Na+/H+ antiporter MnhB subunit